MHAKCLMPTPQISISFFKCLPLEKAHLALSRTTYILNNYFKTGLEESISKCDVPTCQFGIDGRLVATYDTTSKKYIENMLNRCIGTVAMDGTCYNSLFLFLRSTAARMSLCHTCCASKSSLDKFGCCTHLGINANNHCIQLSRHEGSCPGSGICPCVFAVCMCVHA